MGAIKRNIPNFITCLNLLSGVIGILVLFNGLHVLAAYMMFMAALFDFLDGLIARALRVTSAIGKDLDSLADVITFGLLPGFMAMNMAVASQLNSYASYVCLVIPVFSALRLAIFNNDTEQSYSFKGLATPANGLFWACISIAFFKSISPNYTIGQLLFQMTDINRDMVRSVVVLKTEANWVGNILYDYPLIIPILAIVLSLLLVSRIDLIAFKLNNFSFKRYMWHFILLILSVISAVIFGFASAPIILLLYIIISQIHFRTQRHEI